MQYRACIVDSNGHENSRTFVCASDEDAVVWARQMLHGNSVELWCGERLVKRLPASEDNRAVTHEVHEGRMVPKGKE
ncbi:hypothetical protein [Bradyrhizobium sp. 151]|uniref:hypothetical protein n=1 Tax=Bradyrhizobium sp. 151 TaxID=2782626 RepID=UPI001FF850A4|nr:hypothetical protein [Bradyrhizobium sp. 151]MCK1656173.1 hypothetical protein [Bradyrhizobium sp. 151]